MPNVITYREALTKGIREALIDNDDCFLMGEDVGAYGGAYAVSKGLLEEYGPKRIGDSPLSESAIVGLGTGSSMVGLKPIIEIMTINFLLVALDQLVNHAAKIRYMSANQYAAPFMVRTVTGGGAQLGATHSQCFEPWLASVPGLKVVAPSSPYDALGLFRSAIKEKDPIVFVEHILLYGSKGIVDEDYYEIPIGKANVVRSGDNLTLVAYSKMVPLCIEVANTLEEQGIDVEVIDLRSLRPWDKETIINSVNKTNRLVIVEEAWRSGGFGAEIASTVQEEAFDSLDGPIGRVGGLEVPMPYTSVLESQVIPSKDRIIEYIHQNLNT